MVKVEINGVQYPATKTEVRFAQDAIDFMKHKDGKTYAQKHFDIIMRSAPNAAAAIRRKAIARALGLSDVVTFS